MASAIALESSSRTGPGRREESVRLVPLSDIAQEHIIQVYFAVGRNKTRAARILDIDVKTLYNKLKRYGVR